METVAFIIVAWIIINYFLTLNDDKKRENKEYDKYIKDALHRHNTKEEPIPTDDNIIMGLRKKTSKTMLAQQYIASEEWDKKRKFVLARDKYTCQRCDVYDTRLNVHHITYANHFKEQPEDLITVCDQCHQELHNIYGYPNYDDKQDLITRYYYDI